MITFVTGVMQSRKSELLIRTIDNYVAKGCTALVIKSSIDVRDGAFVKSRSLNRSIPAMVINERNAVSVNMLWRMLTSYGTIFIDESQFFSDDFIKELAARCAGYGDCNICASGLTFDFRGDFFPSSYYLLFEADKIVQMQGKCYLCNQTGFTSVKRVDAKTGDIMTEGEQIAVESEQAKYDYINLCIKCIPEWNDAADDDGYYS